MPEGHVTHGLARDLRQTLRGTPVRATSPQGRFTEGAALVDGLPLLRTDAWGKYLFLDFGHGRIVHIHLGLIGKLRSTPVSSAPGPGVRLRLENDAHAWQLTGPTRCSIVTPAEKKAIVAPLGADPLRAKPDVDAMRVRMQRRRVPIGAVLLDQTVIAGLGNVYRAELLFLRGIHPLRLASTLSDDEVDGLWAETVLQLKRGLRMGRIVTRAAGEVRSLTRLEPEDRLYVYHRETCRWCGTELQTLVLAGRPLQYCPVHQPL
jgi:endonuclease VIII